MMVANQHQRTQEAIDWLIRQRDPLFADWGAFTAWLEADAANSEEFGRISLLEGEIAERLSGVMPAFPPTSAKPGEGIWKRKLPRRGILAVASAAAAALGLVLVPNFLAEPQSLYAVATPAGVQKEIALAGVTVSLNGDTRVVLDRANPRFARLLRGEASFEVVHDPNRPFELEVGGARMVDIGTRFNVLKAAEATTLEVAEGAVEYISGGTIVRVEAGEQLRVARGEVLLSKVDPATVGTWREGRLIFDGDPLALVAQDLSRSIGKPVDVDPSVATMPVTAVIQLPRDAKELPPQLETLLGIKVQRTGKGWILTSGD